MGEFLSLPHPVKRSHVNMFFRGVALPVNPLLLLRVRVNKWACGDAAVAGRCRMQMWVDVCMRRVGLLDRIHETVAGERVWYIARTELVNNKGLG